jgi:hypothetical protein
MKLRTALLSLFLGSSALAIPVTIGVESSSCTPAQSAEFGTIGQLVLSDVAAGKTLAQIEADVADALFGNTVVTNQVVAIVNNLLQLLLAAAATPSSAPDAGPVIVVPQSAVIVMQQMVQTIQLQGAGAK